jgi:hypothetical protein
VRLLLRILITIPIGYVAACLAAGLVFAMSLHPVLDNSDPAARSLAIVFGLIVAAHAGAVAAAPTLVAVLLAEAFQWRSFFFWALFGGILGLAAKALIDSPATVQTPQMVVLYAAAGLTAGTIYWLLAGRSSGAIPRRDEHQAVAVKTQAANASDGSGEYR